MKEPLIQKIQLMKICELGFDMMGYIFDEKNYLTFHHLMVPRRVCKQTGLGDGCFYSNIAVLTGDTAHTYLHTIEEIDPDMFFDITSELIDENIKRRIELENLKRIREILLSFEKEHEGEIKKHNQLLIKPEYIEKRIKL